MATSATRLGKEGAGIYVSGHDFGKGETVAIEGTPHEVTKMRRIMMEEEAVTLVIKARQIEGRTAVLLRRGERQ